MDCHSREVISQTESHMREVGDLELKIDLMQRRFGEELDRIRTDSASQLENELRGKDEAIEALRGKDSERVKALGERIEELEIAQRLIKSEREGQVLVAMKQIAQYREEYRTQSVVMGELESQIAQMDKEVS